MVPVLGFIAFGAVGLCVYMMQSRMDEVKASLDASDDTALHHIDTGTSGHTNLSEDVRERLRKTTAISDNFCAYLDSLKSAFLNNGGVASVSETAFSARVLHTCQSMMDLVTDTAAKAKLAEHQFCISAEPGEVKKIFTSSSQATVMAYLEKMETSCRTFETQVAWIIGAQ